MFTTSSIIDNLNHSEGLEYKKLCRVLKITKKSDKDKLDIALTALEKLEIIKSFLFYFVYCCNLSNNSNFQFSS